MLMLLLSFVVVTPASAGGLLAADVVRLVRAQDPGVRAAREAVGLAEAAQLEAGLYANPALAWEREERPGEREEFLSLSLPVDLSLGRSARRHLAGADVAGANAQAARVTSQTVVQALGIFYRLLGQKERSVIEAHALKRLVEAARVVRRRREEGSASGYDQSRIEIESELAASTLRQTEAGVARLRGELASLLGVVPGEVTFEGALEADPALVSDPSLEPGEERQPSLLMLRTAVDRAGRARRAATWSWLPELVFSGGPRLGREGLSEMPRLGREELRETGYRVGVALELPVFSRGQELRSKASARLRYAQALAEAAERRARRERTRASLALEAARAEVLRLAETTGDRIARLERAAESGYREGELSVVELLDARRAGTRLKIRQLELSLSLKEAEVALSAARGEYE